MKPPKKLVKAILRWALLVGLLMNGIAFFHAYQFTHFSTRKIIKSKNPEKLSTLEKLQTLLMGVRNPRPTNGKKPSHYIDLKLQSNKELDCWYLRKEDSVHGTVVLFHGYSGNKSLMLDKAEEFEKLHYNVLLVDFMGSGGSEGNQTTLGFKESEEVNTVYNYVKNQGEKNIILYGTSMGAVAIMKALSDYPISPTGIILECPFGSMYQTTCARFKIMKVPPFPMAGLLVFWGGIQNGFWAPRHNPCRYAKDIKTPTLLLYGERDQNVSREEIQEIYKNLHGTKKLITYENAGHENYLIRYKEKWIKDIADFLHTSR